jgi:hypothetical protein
MFRTDGVFREAKFTPGSWGNGGADSHNGMPFIEIQTDTGNTMAHVQARLERGKFRLTE